jgi:hypothetical protein
MPTVSLVLRAMPDPADRPIFRIVTSCDIGGSCRSASSIR